MEANLCPICWDCDGLSDMQCKEWLKVHDWGTKHNAEERLITELIEYEKKRIPEQTM